ncbi:unnamed protein product, partial [Amoebophrya sp. A120]
PSPSRKNVNAFSVPLLIVCPPGATFILAIFQAVKAFLENEMSRSTQLDI